MITDFGDLRDKLNCQYVVNIWPQRKGGLQANGDHRGAVVMVGNAKYVSHLPSNSSICSALTNTLLHEPLPHNRLLHHIIYRSRAYPILSLTIDNSSNKLALHRISPSSPSTGTDIKPSWHIQTSHNQSAKPRAGLAYPLSFPSAHGSEIVRDAYSPDDVSSGSHPISFPPISPLSSHSHIR